MDGPNPSQMDIKVFIPAPMFCLQLYEMYSLNGEKNISFVGKNEIK